MTFVACTCSQTPTHGTNELRTDLTLLKARIETLVLSIRNLSSRWDRAVPFVHLADAMQTILVVTSIQIK